MNRGSSVVAKEGCIDLLLSIEKNWSASSRSIASIRRRHCMASWATNSGFRKIEVSFEVQDKHGCTLLTSCFWAGIVNLMLMTNERSCARWMFRSATFYVQSHFCLQAIWHFTLFTISARARENTVPVFSLSSFYQGVFISSWDSNRVYGVVKPSLSHWF